jgi:uncharacterized YigZ family protein
VKDRYFAVKGETQNEIIIEKSRFICSVKRVNGEDDAKSFVSSIKEKYPDATHNCYAYIADENGFYIKFSDDGEPQGTAGMPMLEVLKNKKLFCTAVVVTRYFGGVKLGAGGLVRAYFQTAKSALATKKIKYEFCDVFSLTLNYDELHKVDGFLQNNYAILSKDFDMDIKVTFAVKKGEFQEDNLAELLNKKPAISWLKEGFMPV